MTRIGLISDTHGYLDDAVFQHFADCDEIWHGGDFGSNELAERLIAGPWKKSIIFRGVYGNIDGPDIRKLYPEKIIFTCEKIKVFIQHIGGYPGKYAPGVKQTIIKEKPGLFISGHSHILKIMYDDHLQSLHMNPGAAGKQGWHTKRTLIRFTVDGDDMKDCEVVELG